MLSNIEILYELLGKFAKEAIRQGDECIILSNSKIAEFAKLPLFPSQAKLYSKVDWCRTHWRQGELPGEDLSWKDLFQIYVREGRHLSIDYERALTMVSQLYQWFDVMLQKEQPDAVLHEVPSSLFSKIAYLLCKKHRIPYLGITSSVIGGRIGVHDLEHTCSKYEKEFQTIEPSKLSKTDKEFAFNFLENYISHKALPPGQEFLQHRSEFSRIRNALLRTRTTLWPLMRYTIQRYSFRSFDYESEILVNRQLRYPGAVLMRRLRKLLQSHVFDHFNEKDNFFLFPLQVQHESTVHVLATYFADQLHTIKNIAFTLPFPSKLYVKEHPVAFGDYPTAFYTQMKKIPNVVLLSPKEYVPDLVCRSRGVITLSSSLGLEAALSGRPTYLLGNVFYAHHPLCRTIESFEQLKRAIEKDIAQPPSLSNQDEMNLRFFHSYFRNTIPGDLYAAVHPTDTNDYRAMYRQIKKLFLS